MQSNGTRALVALAAVALVVAAFFVLKGDDDAGDAESTATTAATGAKAQEEAAIEDGAGAETGPTIVLFGGEPEGGVTDLTFAKGDDVRFVVESDADDEIHVHGYDIEQEVAAGGRTEFDFPADIDGIFEVESHGTETEIAKLTITP